jgi:hypothetical protein
VQAFILASISVTLDYGQRTWTDNWVEGGTIISTIAPTLIRAVPKRVIKSQTVSRTTTIAGSPRSLEACLFLLHSLRIVKVL